MNSMNKMCPALSFPLLLSSLLLQVSQISDHWWGRKTCLGRRWQWMDWCSAGLGPGAPPASMCLPQSGGASRVCLPSCSSRAALAKVGCSQHHNQGLTATGQKRSGEDRSPRTPTIRSPGHAVSQHLSPPLLFINCTILAPWGLRHLHHHPSFPLKGCTFFRTQPGHSWDLCCGSLPTGSDFSSLALGIFRVCYVPF